MTNHGMDSANLAHSAAAAGHMQSRAAIMEGRTTPYNNPSTAQSTLPPYPGSTGMNGKCVAVVLVDWVTSMLSAF